jgi:hypothetical protein
MDGGKKMNDELTPRDFLDREISVGDIIVYPVRRGSSMWLNKIKVTAIGSVHRQGRREYRPIHGVNENGRRITLSKLERSVIVTLLCEYCGHNPCNSEG